MSFRDEMRGAAFDAARGLSFGTREQRVNVSLKFAGFLASQNIQIRKIEQVTAKHVSAYVASRLAAGGTKGTLQTEMSHLRAALAKGGKENLNKLPELSNKGLGISGRSRDGTKRSMTDTEIRERVERIEGRGERACAGLMEALGLRKREAIMSAGSLRYWGRALANGEQIKVTDGTKGGRGRYVDIADKAKALEAIREALRASKEQGGKLIDRPNLKSAKDHFSYVLGKAGFKGEVAGHALRYTFTEKQYQSYLDKGMSVEGALRNCSRDLGHGDGRTDYVSQVYLRKG